MKPIGVFLCCNDQHGTFEGCVRRIRIGEAALDLDAIAMDRPPRISFVEFDGRRRILRVSGRPFPIRAYTHAASNLHYDHVSMESAVAVELLNFLKGKATFAAQGGNSDLFETWSAEGVRFSAQELEAKCAA